MSHVLFPQLEAYDVQVQGQVFKEVGKRQHIWEGDPEGVYVPVDCEATLTCISNEVEVFVLELSIIKPMKLLL